MFGSCCSVVHTKYFFIHLKLSSLPLKVLEHVKIMKILSYTTTYMLYLSIRRNEVFFDEMKFFFRRNEFDEMKFDEINSTK